MGLTNHKKEHKIQDPNKWYSFLRQYVDLSLFQSYREIEYIGLEKIPKDGAVIIAPNHTNALMDALVVLSYDEQPKVFVARADIFKNKKIAKVLNFLRIMPIMRIRDGISEVKKNDETFEKSVEVLLDKVPFCILPEGTHHAKHSLLPLSKGIFRIAIQAQEAIHDKMPLYIVPFGMEYGNFFRFRSTVLVQVGEPINVRDFMREHSEKTQPEIMNLMKDELGRRIKEVILYIPDDEYYDATYELCAVTINEQMDTYCREHYKTRKRDKLTRYLANKTTVAQLQAMKEKLPDNFNKVIEMAQEVFQLRQKAEISLSSVVIHYPFWNRLLKYLIFIICLPYIIACSIVVLPISTVSRILFNKLKDRAFFNSIRYFITLFFWPVLLLIYGIVFFCVFPWPWAVFAIAATMPATIIAQDSFRLLRLMVSDMRLMFNKPLRMKIRNLRNYFLSYNDLV